MTPLPKPTQRPSRPRRPLKRTAIARSRTPIARRARPRARRRGPVAALRREAERLMSRIVLSTGFCAYISRYPDGGMAFCCQKATDCAHVLAKGSWPSVRYYIRNGIPLCRAHHDNVRSARISGVSRMRSLYVALRGPMAWADLVAAASRPMPDIRDIVAELRRAAAHLGIR